MEGKLLCKVSMVLATQYNPTDYIINGKANHIYLTSGRVLKFGDWCLTPKNTIIQASEIRGNLIFYDKKNYFGAFECRRIEATTDNLLDIRLPLIPSKWIKEEYIFKDGKIDEVYIKVLLNEITGEIEICLNEIYFNNVPHSTGQPDYDWANTPKEMAGFRNEVIIIPIKTSWNKKELKLEQVKLLKSYNEFLADNSKKLLLFNEELKGVDWFTKWFNENY